MSNVTTHTQYSYTNHPKGTSTIDGVSLLYACVRFLASPEQGPRVLLATHFTEVIPLLHDTLRIHVSEMVVYMEQEESIPQPLFKLRKGVSNESYGIACARRALVPEEACDRALEVQTVLKQRGTLMDLLPFHKEEEDLLDNFCSVDWAKCSDAVVMAFLG